MTPAWLSRKQFALVIGFVSLVGAAAFLSTGSSRPETISSAGTGAEWQCTRVAGILTTCSKVRHTDPVLRSSHKDKDKACLRRA
jgi:hypothetical protein